MSDNVKIIIGDKSYEFPVVIGSKNERAININELRSQTGLITIDPGYKNSGSCLSEFNSKCRFFRSFVLTNFWIFTH
jgi:citrate synthase